MAYAATFSGLLIGLLLSTHFAIASSNREAGTHLVEAELAAGGSHTCILREDGTARCWGSNSDGQLGNRSTDNSATPVEVFRSPIFKHIAAGLRHTCAVRPDGTMRCWGGNDRGQLGDGTTFQRTIPAPVPGASNARMVAAGGLHSCAVIEGGTVSCWGDNAFGQLATATAAAFSPDPVTIPGLSRAVAVATGFAHSCALIDDSTVKCWGLSGSGQLGGVFDQFQMVLVLDDNSVPASGFVAVTAGNVHSCALRFDGTVWCWGPEDRVGRPNPRFAGPVTDLTDAVAVSAGDTHTCAVRANGTAVCWGLNGFGQIGDGTSGPGNDRLLPVAVSGLINATKITGGIRHSCAMDAIETIRCWGDNSVFQLGNEFGNSSVPVLVAGLNGGVSGRGISTGGFHTCAVRANGTSSCWGENSTGEVGDGSGTDRFVPTQVSGLASQVEISAGIGHSCGLRVDGTVRCWGENGSGQLGNGSTTDRLTPVQVAGLSNVIAVATGGSHTCALRTPGTVHCWGNNENGQLGDGTLTNRLTPVRVNGVSDAIAIAAGGNHTCTLRAIGAVQCWGDNFFGQIGDNTNTDRPNPTPVPGLGGVVGIAAGGSHTCAVLSAGGLVCWGRNSSGQLGDNSTDDRNRPGFVTRLTDVIKVAAGGFHTCAVRIFGIINCWGFNGSGQLGDGTFTQSSVPVAVRQFEPPANGLLTSMLSIAAGFAHSCGIRATGDVFCWGENFVGQIGDGTITDRLFATALPSF